MGTRLSYHPSLRQAFPDLATALVRADDLDQGEIDTDLAVLIDVGRDHLRTGTESDLVEVQAWRRTFAALGLKPTQYRSAAEALLRRLRQHGELPRINPLVDLANAVSVAVALPMAAFDTGRVAGDLEVRAADGDERYDTFAQTIEHPDPGEVVFTDRDRRVHARRWTHRQSGWSAVGPATTDVLIVIEAQHPGGAADVRRAADLLAARLPGATVELL